jgi:L-iditol 2-dehydrogenase
MKVALLEEIGKLIIKDIPAPACPARGLVIKVKACAICGTDIKVYHHGHKLIKFPRITGHEVAGEVVEVGKETRGFKKGDKVVVAAALPCGRCFYCHQGWQSMCDNLTAIGYHYDGGFAEYMAVPEVAYDNDCVNRIGEGLSFAEASLTEPLACVINGQELSGVGLGKAVVVIGAGPIGCLQVMLSHSLGARKVILADISSERLKISQVAEADIYLDLAKVNLKGEVLKITEGRGAEVVIVACSSGKAQESALEIVAKKGNVNFFGGLPKDKPFINFNSNLLHYGEFSAVGTHGSSPRHNAMALDLIVSGKISVKKLITHRLPLEKIYEGLKITEKGEGLKTIIEP